jgi:hypothetical protein
MIMIMSTIGSVPIGEYQPFGGVFINYYGG